MYVWCLFVVYEDNFQTPLPNILYVNIEDFNFNFKQAPAILLDLKFLLWFH